MDDVCLCTLNEYLDGHRCRCPQHTPNSECSWQHEEWQRESQALKETEERPCSRCGQPFHGNPYLEHGDGRVGV